MTAQPSLTQLPAVSTFDFDSAVFRPALLPLTTREEVRLEILAHEFVRYRPDLAGLLEESAMKKLRAELEYA